MTNYPIYVFLSTRQDYAPAVEAYRCREDMSKLLKLKPTRKRSDGAPDLDKDPPVFKNGGSLRDYQREVDGLGSEIFFRVSTTSFL